MGWGGWVLMTVGFLLYWGAVIALGVWAVRSYRSEPSRGWQAPTSGSADQLSERFARGEIDADEFQRRREVLHPTAGPK